MSWKDRYRQLKVGDKIIVTTPENNAPGKKGDILTIRSLENNGNIRVVEQHGAIFYKREFERYKE